MKPLDLQSERYGALGNLASEGVKNQLGRPRLDQLTVLIRESVQNSWDAHDPSSPHIAFDLRVEAASSEQLECWPTPSSQMSPRTSASASA